MGGKQEQSALVLELFETRRDIMSRISEDLVKEKKQLDVEVGCDNVDMYHATRVLSIC